MSDFHHLRHLLLQVKQWQKFSIHNYYLSTKTHIWAFKKVGLALIRWIEIEIPIFCAVVSWWLKFYN